MLLEVGNVPEADKLVKKPCPTTARKVGRTALVDGALITNLGEAVPG